MKVFLAAALAVLLLLAAVGGSYGLALYTWHREQAAAQHAGQLIEAKLCSTFGKLAALQPPPGDPAANPSRAYLQAEHATLVQLGDDLGCNRRPR